MRRRFRRLAFATALAFSSAASAQAVPDVIRSASLTKSQADELTRRLTAYSGRIADLERELRLREGAVRNIAVEIFGAQPELLHRCGE